MAKTYARTSRKRTPGRGRGRYSRRKTSGRVYKKGRGTATSRVKSLIAGEVAKALSNGAQSERRKVTLEVDLENPAIRINGKERNDNCIRIPITQALPSMGSSQCGLDVRRRGTNKIMVTAVNVRMSMSTSDETRLLVALYEPHETVRKLLDEVPMSMSPDPRQGFVPEKVHTRLVPFQSMGLVCMHGPLMTKKSGGTYDLDSTDGTPYGSRVSTHPGKPIGRVFKDEFKDGLQRTQNWDLNGAKAAGLGYTYWPTRMINEYWALKKPYVYMYEGQNDPVSARNMEMFVYLDCPSLQWMEQGMSEEVALVGAVVRKVLIDIYYHDM